MASTPSYARPSFDEAVKAWQSRLGLLGLPTSLLWVFDENLCFERRPGDPSDFRLGYQVDFTPPPADAERVAYDYFSEFGAPLVFYRIGSSKSKSVCLLLCDKWFETKTEAEGYARRDDWRMWFRAGPQEEVEEIKDQERWRRRILRDRPLHDLDFCMTLQGVHETLAHGRVLTAYERYGLKLLHGWRKFLRAPE
jgi:hypothetical protein